MITLEAKSGAFIKHLSPGETYGAHQVFGWIPERTYEARRRLRIRHGLKLSGRDQWAAKFKIVDANDQWSIEGVENCQAKKLDAKRWLIATPLGEFIADANSAREYTAHPKKTNDSEKLFWQSLLATLFITLALLFAMPKSAPVEAPQVVSEPVHIKLPEKQKLVSVPLSNQILEKVVAQAKTAHARKAIAQNLGFIGLLGKKDLKKAMGSAPTEIKDASPGAGSGGAQGSGGELLVGNGDGVLRASVGNSGVAGLGGIGTKGRGGGAGGYGNSMVGSGDAKSLASVALSQDVVMEGGLDRSVIQATIAKYLSQVRNCYEEGLHEKPGLNGQVTMGFEIGADGMLKYANVARSSLQHRGVESCISAKMMTWQFPKPLGGVNVKVSYPFLLRPARS